MMSGRRSTRFSRRLALAALLLAPVLSPVAGGVRRVAAEPPLPVRKTGLGRKGPTLVASVGLQDLFTPIERERLKSGFSTRVLIRVFLQHEGEAEPIAAAFQRAEIVYDIWDERFRVRVSQGLGTDRTIEVATAELAIAAATALVQLPVADRTQLRPGDRYFLAIRGDLNPLSQELQAELRRWLRQPAGAQRRPGAGDGDSFFGSFVTVFANPQIEESERQVRFVSQTFRGEAF